VSVQVIQDFADEDCVYLELRTTPKVHSRCYEKHVGAMMSDRTCMHNLLTGADWELLCLELIIAVLKCSIRVESICMLSL
jgi:hypothetical protein